MSEDLRAHDAALERLKALHPKLIDLSLGRIERTLQALGRPQDRLPPVIHVAGTNGKGSTVAFMRAIAEAAGLKVHVLTSPHLVRYVERIRLSGRLIEEPALAAVLERVEAANDGAPITFFEIMTAAAILAFSEAPADLCLIEVGLGGRFDATNVVDPAVSVIAPVDLDHQEFLGAELSRIAWEKAGIIKPGRPTVSSRQAPEAMEAIQQEADRQGAPLSVAGQDFEGVLQAGRLAFSDQERLLDLDPPSLPGAHQIDNAALAIAALLAWGHPALAEPAFSQGLRAATWPGRMQRLKEGPLGRAARARNADLWLDGGHNPHAARALAVHLGALAARDGRPVTLIVGMLARKDAEAVLKDLKPLQARLIVTGFSSETAAPSERLKAAAASAGVAAEEASTLQGAVELALAPDGPAPHVVVWGSLHLVGEALSLDPATWPT